MGKSGQAGIVPRLRRGFEPGRSVSLTTAHRRAEGSEPPASAARRGRSGNRGL